MLVRPGSGMCPDCLSRGAQDPAETAGTHSVREWIRLRQPEHTYCSPSGSGFANDIADAPGDDFRQVFLTFVPQEIAVVGGDSFEIGREVGA